MDTSVKLLFAILIAAVAVGTAVAGMLEFYLLAVLFVAFIAIVDYAMTRRPPRFSDLEFFFLQGGGAAYTSRAETWR